MLVCRHKNKPNWEAMETILPDRELILGWQLLADRTYKVRADPAFLEFMEEQIVTP